MKTNFNERYLSIKSEERDMLNNLLKGFPTQEFHFGKTTGISVTYNTGNGVRTAKVKRLTYPVLSGCGIFVEEEGKEIEIGYLDIGLGEMALLMESMGDPKLAELNEQCKRIVEKVSESTEYDKETMNVDVDYTEDNKSVYTIYYDDGPLENAVELPYGEIRRYLDGIEFAVDMWIAEI